jgi:hypothetical protein
VWNDNAPLPDTLIGSVKLQLDALTLLPLGAKGKAYELELTMPDKPTAKRGKLSITAVMTAVAPTAAAKEDKGQPVPPGRTSGMKGHEWRPWYRRTASQLECLLLLPLVPSHHATG